MQFGMQVYEAWRIARGDTLVETLVYQVGLVSLVNPVLSMRVLFVALWRLRREEHEEFELLYSDAAIGALHNHRTPSTPPAARQSLAVGLLLEPDPTPGNRTVLGMRVTAEAQRSMVPPGPVAPVPSRSHTPPPPPQTPPPPRLPLFLPSPTPLVGVSERQSLALRRSPEVKVESDSDELEDEQDELIDEGLFEEDILPERASGGPPTGRESVSDSESLAIRPPAGTRRNLRVVLSPEEAIDPPSPQEDEEALRMQRRAEKRPARAPPAAEGRETLGDVQAPDADKTTVSIVLSNGTTLVIPVRTCMIAQLTMLIV